MKEDGSRYIQDKSSVQTYVGLMDSDQQQTLYNTMMYSTIDTHVKTSFPSSVMCVIYMHTWLRLCTCINMYALYVCREECKSAAAALAAAHLSSQSPQRRPLYSEADRQRETDNHLDNTPQLHTLNDTLASLGLAVVDDGKDLERVARTYPSNGKLGPSEELESEDAVHIRMQQGDTDQSVCRDDGSEGVGRAGCRGKTQRSVSRALSAQSANTSLDTTDHESSEDFDYQKHRAVVGLLGLLGAPVNPTGVDGRVLVGAGAPNSVVRTFRAPQALGPASHPGVGYVIQLAAALLAGPAGTEVVDRGGSGYPTALQAARLVIDRIGALMCPGELNGLQMGGVRGGREEGEGVCEAGCLMLQDLQVVGEQEREMTARADYLPVNTLKVWLSGLASTGDYYGMVLVVVVCVCVGGVY